MTMILMIGLGGAAGSVARYLVSTWIQRRSRSGFPWGTFVVNATGSFLIGVVFGAFDHGAYSGDALTLMVAGVLGGYTTFSTYSVENANLLENHRYRWLLLNAVGQIAGGLLVAAAGYSIASWAI